MKDTSGTIERAIALIKRHWPVTLDTIVQVMRACDEARTLESYVTISEALLLVGENSAAQLVNRLSIERLAAAKEKLTAMRQQSSGGGGA